MEESPGSQEKPKNATQTPEAVETKIPATPSEPIAPSPKVPGTSFLEKLRKKRKLFLVSVIVIILLILASGGVFYYQRSISQDRPESYTQPSTLLTPPPSFSPPPSKEKASVEYIKREKIFESVNVPEGEDFMYYSFDSYKVGTITSGKYKDWDLLLALVVGYGPCKGSGCRKPFHLRYIRKENQVVFLPKISSKDTIYINEELDLRTVNPFQKLGLNLTSDNEFTIPILEYPETLIGAKPKQVINLLTHGREEDGEFDQTKLTIVFEHDIFSAVYTTRSEVAPSKSFYTLSGLESSKLDEAVFANTRGCRGATCFHTNAFFVFRPDGTFLMYIYRYDFIEYDYTVTGITWSDSKDNQARYDTGTLSGVCGDDVIDYSSVVSPQLFSDADLEIVGKVESTGDPIYAIKDKNHKLFTEFYDNYRKHYADWDDMTVQNYFEGREPKSYNEFLTSRPLFLWRDPFGRLIRFNNKEFTPPLICEPIIYFYPENRHRVDIKLSKNVQVADSTPSYQDGWKITANPSGEIQDITDNRTYPYLFWEGWSYVFPLQERGFVVKQSEAEEFFSKTLPKLGLNQKETTDFLEAWLPYFSDSPYYFITFINQEVIDRIAPLEISPKPDTVIRILMDYKPLKQPVVVSQLKLQDPPDREGFTVVEWGGLKR
jgi:hypothetical protein